MLRAFLRARGRSAAVRLSHSSAVRSSLVLRRCQSTAAPAAATQPTPVHADQQTTPDAGATTAVAAAAAAASSLSSSPAVRPGGAGAGKRAQVLEIVKLVAWCTAHSTLVAVARDVIEPLVRGEIQLDGEFSMRQLGAILHQLDADQHGQLAAGIYSRFVRPALQLDPLPRFDDIFFANQADVIQLKQARPTQKHPTFEDASVLHVMAAVLNVFQKRSADFQIQTVHVYFDMWKLIETYDIDFADFKFNHLPVWMIVKGLHAQSLSDHVVHLLATTKLEWYQAIQAWYARVRALEADGGSLDDKKRLKQSYPRWLNPTVPSMHDLSDGMMNIMLVSFFRTGNQSKRRALEYFVQMSREQNALIESLIAGDVAIDLRNEDGWSIFSDLTPPITSRLSMQQLILVSIEVSERCAALEVVKLDPQEQQALLESASAIVDVQHAQLLEKAKLSADLEKSASAPGDARTELEKQEAEEAEAEMKRDFVEKHTIHTGVSTSRLGSRAVLTQNRHTLLAEAVNFFVADWVRWITAGRDAKKLMGGLPQHINPRTWSARSLTEVTHPLCCTLLTTLDLSRQLLQQLVEGFAKFGRMGGQAAMVWYRVLYNRSINPRAEALELSLHEQTQLDALGMKMSDLQKHRLLMDEKTWQLGLEVYARGTATWSHSIASMLPNAFISPYAMMRHILTTHYVHKQVDALSVYPPDQLMKMPQSDLPLLGLSWRHYYTLWHQLEIMRWELASEVQTYHSAKEGSATTGKAAELGAFPRVAEQLYTRLSEEFLEVAVQEMLQRGMFQIVEGLVPSALPPHQVQRGRIRPDTLVNAKRVFVVHVPSTLFSVEDSLLTRSDMVMYTRFAFKSLQHLVHTGKLDVDSLGVAIVTSVREPPQAAARSNTFTASNLASASTSSGATPAAASSATEPTAMERKMSESFYPSPPRFNAFDWRRQMSTVLPNAVDDILSRPCGPTILPPAVEAALVSPRGHVTTGFRAFCIPVTRVMRWFAIGCPMAISDCLLLPRNASLADSHRFTFPNTPVNVRKWPETWKMPDLSAVKNHPRYATQTYYLRADSSFVMLRSHRTASFDGNFDLQQQADEWQSILHLLKRRGRPELEKKEQQTATVTKQQPKSA